MKYLDEDWARAFAEAGLDGFEDFWAMDTGWVEKPNERRGGWSGASRFSVKDGAGESVALFMKRQENHNFRKWTNPFKWEPTFFREYENILAFRKMGIATLDLVYFEKRVVEGNKRAILITKDLVGYRSLSEYFQIWDRDGWPEREERELFSNAIADLVRKLHGSGWGHYCLYPNHVFVKSEGGKMNVRLIDLEKARETRKSEFTTLEDIGSFYRRSKCVSLRDRIRFFRRYCGVDRLGAGEKSVWAQIYD